MNRPCLVRHDPALAVVLVGPRAAHLALSTVTLKEAQEIATLSLRATSPEQARELARTKLPVLAELGL